MWKHVRSAEVVAPDLTSNLSPARAAPPLYCLSLAGPRPAVRGGPRPQPLRTGICTICTPGYFKSRTHGYGMGYGIKTNKSDLNSVKRLRLSIVRKKWVSKHPHHFGRELNRFPLILYQTVYYDVALLPEEAHKPVNEKRCKFVINDSFGPTWWKISEIVQNNLLIIYFSLKYKFCGNLFENWSKTQHRVYTNEHIRTFT